MVLKAFAELPHESCMGQIKSHGLQVAAFARLVLEPTELCVLMQDRRGKFLVMLTE